MKSSIIKNYLYNAAYQIVLIIVPLLTTPYLSRVFSAEQLGIYSYHYSIAYYFSIFIILGLNNYGNRQIAIVKDEKRRLSETFCSIYSMQLGFGFLVILSYYIYISALSKNKEISSIFFVYVVSEIFNINWLFYGLEEFRITVRRSIVIKILSTAGIFIFVRDSSDINIYCIIMTVSALLNQVMLWAYIPKHILFEIPSFYKVRRHIKPNLLLFLSVLGTSLYKYMDKIMLGKMGTMDEVGYYEQSEKIIALPVAFIVSLGTTMLPRISNIEAVSGKDDIRISSYFQRSILFSMFLSASMSFGIMGVSREFVPFFYGPGFDKIVILFNILLPSCIFLGIGNVITTQFLIPRGNDNTYIKSIFLGAVINILINALLIPRYRSVGAAIGTLCAEITVCIYKIAYSNKEMKTMYAIRHGIPFCIIGIIMCFILNITSMDFLSNTMAMLIKIIMGCAIFTILTLLYVMIIKFRRKQHAR